MNQSNDKGSSSSNRGPGALPPADAPLNLPLDPPTLPPGPTPTQGQSTDAPALPLPSHQQAQPQQIPSQSKSPTSAFPPNTSSHIPQLPPQHDPQQPSKLQKKAKQPPVVPESVKEPKKKRRFFGFGGDSKDSSSPSTSGTKSGGLFGRSLSTRSRPTSFQVNSSATTAHSLTENRSTISPDARPEPIAEEPSSDARPGRSYRHSIAIVPPAAATTQGLKFDSSEDAQHDDLPSPSSSIAAPYSPYKTSTTQSNDLDEGSKPSSARSERNRAPAAASSSPYPTYNTHYLNVSDSRPSSRQSIEPSSPVQTQYIPYHPRGAVSQSSVNKLDISRDPSPGLPPSALTREHSAQGSYGQQLDVGSASKKQHKQISMVQNNDGGRSTPPPSKSKEDLASLDFPTLLSKHEELNDKYRKVKKYYFEKDAQVQQLQNTLAHQRLSQSRTSLDDNEYANRFQRLDGAINNLAFNVRKDWKAVPPWLSPFVNNDATTKVSKEMTAVGRACISRWLVDEIFDRVFHPGLDPLLSSSLKIIERNIRRSAPPVNTEEEREALLTKISNWRLATLDGLHEALNSPQAVENRTELTRGLVDTLTSDLQMNLTTPPPVGLEAGVVGIIELAVGVVACVPQESRDVYVEYILPGIPLNDYYMKVEGTLPPLTNPGESYGADQDQHLQQRRGSADEPMSEDVQGQAGGPPMGGFHGAGQKEKKGNGQSKKEDGMVASPEKIRFAGFMSVMIKGKTMLVKAPVFL